MKRRVGAALAASVIAASCGVTAGDTLNQCQDNLPAPCNTVAHCVLDSDQYLTGQFPGSQVFVVRTDTAQQVTFSFTFDNRISAGTGLRLTSTEPDCSGESSYQSNGDLFELSGASGVLSFPITMMDPGDHLIQFTSDAYCSYTLSYQ
jgi:hypothetical protein